MIKKFCQNRYSHIRFRLVDFNCLGYMAVIGLLLPFFHRQVPRWHEDFLIHVIFVISGLEVIRLGEKYPQNRIYWTLRTFYPVAFYAYGYLEIDHLNRMLFGSYWAIDFLVNADKAIFGVHPTIGVQQFYAPWLGELMSICYWGYHLFVPLATLPLFLKGKREETLAAFSIVTFTYFINFFLFYIFPALSPRMIPWLEEMHTADYSGYLVASFTQLVQGDGVIRGGCFPSSHVSGSLAWSLAAFRYNRRMGYALLPMVFGVAMSTVYLRYHHAVDPIAGLILGFICYPIALAILKKRREDPIILLESTCTFNTRMLHLKR